MINEPKILSRNDITQLALALGIEPSSCKRIIVVIEEDRLVRVVSEGIARENGWDALLKAVAQPERIPDNNPHTDKAEWQDVLHILPITKGEVLDWLEIHTHGHCYNHIRGAKAKCFGPPRCPVCQAEQQMMDAFQITK